MQNEMEGSWRPLVGSSKLGRVLLWELPGMAGLRTEKGSQLLQIQSHEL